MMTFMPWGAMFVLNGWLWLGLFYVAMAKATGNWHLT